MATISFSIPILTIPLYYVLATYPHGHAIVLASKGKPRAHDNRNPQSGVLARIHSQTAEPARVCAVGALRVVPPQSSGEFPVANSMHIRGDTGGEQSRRR